MRSQSSLMDRTFVKVGKMKDVGNDLRYWLSKSPQERLDALESIRREYNDWKYGPRQRFQRVYRVVKRK